MPIGPTRRLAGVVLNFRTPDDTILAVQSLRGSTRPPDDLIVVDNDSGPGCRDRVAGLHASIRYLSAGANLGFSGGMNVGIRAALARGARAVLLLNSDATVMPECVARLEESLDADVGITAPIIVGAGPRRGIVSSGIDFHPSTGRMRERSTLPQSAVTTVDAVSGCVILVAAEVFETIGLLEPDYFYSFEDIDFCLRARLSGFRTAVVRDAVASHAESRTIGWDATNRFYYAARNHLLLARRIAPRGGRLAALGRTAIIVSLNFAHALTSRRGRLRQRLSAVFRGTRDYFHCARGDECTPSPRV